MKISTAKWIVIILGSASVLAISTYFFLDEKDMMVPFLSTIIQPFILIVMPPVIFLLAAMLLAINKKETKISRTSFKRAINLIIALLFYKLLTGYFSK